MAPAAMSQYLSWGCLFARLYAEQEENETVNSVSSKATKQVWRGLEQLPSKVRVASGRGKI